MSVAPDTTVALHDRFARELPEMVVSWQAQTFPNPRLLAFNAPLAGDLGLDPGWLQSPDGVRFLVGNHVPDGASPVAQAYAGHQFGGYVPQLGDGRALLLGELVGADGRLRDIHLKGSGATPFARGGDGLAAVGPMLREYIVSEAMHALGVPTTRSLAVVSTGRMVQRETALPGAVLTRVAASHLRVGSFQYASATGRSRPYVRRLADHAISSPLSRVPRMARSPLPGAVRSRWPPSKRSLVAPVDADRLHPRRDEYRQHDDLRRDHRLRPLCAFMEAYDPDTVFSSIDQWGRYAYANQPVMAALESRPVRRSTSPPARRQWSTRALRSPKQAFGGFRDQYDADMDRRGCVPSSGCPPKSTPQTVTSLIGECAGPAEGEQSRLHLVLPRPRATQPAVMANPPAGCSSTWPASTAWIARWRTLSTLTQH